MADGNPAKRVRRAPAAVSIDFTSEKLPFVTLTNGAGDTVKVYPYGACVTSYVKGGKEVFAMRADNKMDGTKPISGGIPICFPQFGGGAMQSHGFARNCTWDIAEISDGPEEPSVVFSLSDSAYTRGMWDYAFEFRYTVELGIDSLDTTFSVLNKGLLTIFATACALALATVTVTPIPEAAFH